MPPRQRPAHLAPSELGTKEYWDNLYATEVANHASNPQDTGTVWFDDADAEAKMVQYLVGLDDEGALPAGAAILDLGCGNGSLMRAVRAALFADGVRVEEEEEPEAGAKEEQPLRRQRRPCLLNVDYSEASIALARTITQAEEEAEVEEDADDDDDAKQPTVPIDYAVWDVLNGRPEDLLAAAGDQQPLQAETAGAVWDIVLDKGTFDAISLGAGQESDAATGDHASTDGNDGRGGSRAVESRYRAQVLRLLRPGGRLLITSCNWTEAELCAWMEGDGDSADGEADADADAAADGGRFVQVGAVAYPSFQFGGVQGQAVVTLCFEKRPR